MNAFQQAIHTARTKGTASYFPLDTLTNQELLTAYRLFDQNTRTENEAIREIILERMA